MMPSPESPGAPPPFGPSAKSRVIIPLDIFARLAISLAQASDGIRQSYELFTQPVIDYDAAFERLDSAVMRIGEIERILRICLEES